MEQFWVRLAREDPASSAVGVEIVGGIAQCSLSLMGFLRFVLRVL